MPLMKDDHKTKKQLAHELVDLRSQNAEQKKSITGNSSAELAAEAIGRYAESIVETVREPLLVLDADLKIISANRNFYRAFKVTPGETIGSFIYDLGNKQWDIPKLRELLEEVLPEKEAFDDFEVAHDFQDIGHKVMLLNARQVYRKDIDAKMILLAIEDITERKGLEDLLSESEERFRRLFETANDGIVLLEKHEGKITHSNPAVEKMLGYTEKEGLGKKLQDIGILLDLGDFQMTMQNLNRSGMIKYDDVPAETKSGQHIDTDIYLVDRSRLVQCNIRDITERKRAEEALRKSEEIYRMVVDNIADVITVMDLNLCFTYVSPSIIRLRGYTAEEVMSQTMEQIMTPESRQIVAQAFEEEMKLEAGGAADLGRTLILELEEYRKDGSTVWLENHISTIRDNEKKLLGIIALSRDITKRKQAEQALRDAETLYHLLFEHSPDGIVIIDPSTLKPLEFNETAHRQLGYSREEFTRLSISDLDIVETPEETKSHVANVIHEGRNDFDTRHRTKQGAIRDIHVTAQTIEILGHPVYHCIWRDITERKKTEEDLKETLESLRNAVRTTIRVMVSAVETRDPYTSGHQIRSADLAGAIAVEMGLSQDQVDRTRMAGSIHDIGKLSVPAEILSKPTKLSEAQFALIKEHSQSGYEILKNVESSWPLAEIVYQHHERMDGSGYPRALKGEEIIVEARVLAVADVVESMASHRPYRPALGIEAALDEIERNAGIYYDDAVVESCLRLFREKDYQLLQAA